MLGGVAATARNNAERERDVEQTRRGGRMARQHRDVRQQDHEQRDAER